MKKEYFILSDIHSREVSIDDFINRGFDPNNDNHVIVLLGDYFDRFNKPYEVLLFCEYIMDTYPNRSILLKGNHDEMLENLLRQMVNSNIHEEVLMDPIDYKLFIANGGHPTMSKLIGGVSQAANMTPAKMYRVKRVLSFLNKLQYTYETDKYLFVHAGFDQDGKVDTWTPSTIYEENNTGKIIVAGHMMFEYLEETFVEIQKLETGMVAVNKRINNNVLLIDDGTGNNIVKLKEWITLFLFNKDSK